MKILIFVLNFFILVSSHPPWFHKRKDPTSIEAPPRIVPEEDINTVYTIRFNVVDELGWAVEEGYYKTRLKARQLWTKLLSLADDNYEEKDHYREYIEDLWRL